MRVMSFNVRGALHLDGLNAWPLRRHLVENLIRVYRPNIIGFQEVLWPAYRFLTRKLFGYANVSGNRTGHWLFAARNPVFYSRREFASHGAGAFWLSATPERRSLPSGAQQVRGATWVSLFEGERRFFLVNTHFDHGGPAARETAAQVILDRLRFLGWPRVPAIVLGDFNADADGPVHAAFLAAGFRDTFLDAGHCDENGVFTYHGFQGGLFPGEGRIDWILCSGPLHVARATIVRDAAPPLYPSDHYPVLADLYWQ